MPTRALTALLGSIVDYAGLFPPAKLGMPAAVETFARDRAGLHAWMLSRFVCPVSRIDEFSKVAAPLLPGTFATSGYREHVASGEPWPLTVLCDGAASADPERGFVKDLERIAAFNIRHAHEENGLAVIDTIEVKPPTPDFIDSIIDEIPDDIFPFFEIPSDGDARGFIAALPGHAAGAKIRTGGLTPDAFPTAQRIALFIDACRLADVPFKATAGLHHPICGAFPLTYEKNAPQGRMFGFLNVFIAAVLSYARRAEIDTLVACLSESNPAAFAITEEGLSWHNTTFEIAEVARVREAFAVSFGSCAFDEPVAELRALNLL